MLLEKTLNVKNRINAVCVAIYLNYKEKDKNETLRLIDIKVGIREFVNSI